MFIPNKPVVTLEVAWVRRSFHDVLLKVQINSFIMNESIWKVSPEVYCSFDVILWLKTQIFVLPVRMIIKGKELYPQLYACQIM